MASKIKNIVIFLAIAAALVLIYIFFIKKAPESATLISSSPSPLTATTPTAEQNSSMTQDFLSILLNVTNIKLDDAIFSDNAFQNLHDSSITLVPDGNEGRPNPFAPIGTDVITSVPVNSQANASASAASGTGVNTGTDTRTGTATGASANIGAGASTNANANTRTGTGTGSTSTGTGTGAPLTH